MEDKIYLTFWDHNAADTFLYGSTLCFYENRLVECENNRMNSGIALRTWYSQVNYQERRLEPQLPLLEPGVTYELHPFFKCEPQNGLLLRMNYYDRRGNLLGFGTTGERGGSFQCPQGTHSWTLQLVQAGSIRFWFHHIEIRSRSAKMMGPGALWNTDICSDTLNILLPDLSGSMFCYPEINRVWGISNLTVAPTDYVTAAELLQPTSMDWVRDNSKLRCFSQKRLLAYGVCGQEAARFLEYQERCDVLFLRDQNELYEIELP